MLSVPHVSHDDIRFFPLSPPVTLWSVSVSISVRSFFKAIVSASVSLHVCWVSYLMAKVCVCVSVFSCILLVLSCQFGSAVSRSCVQFPYFPICIYSVFSWVRHWSVCVTSMCYSVFHPSIIPHIILRVMLSGFCS